MKRIFRTRRQLLRGEVGSGKTKVALDFIGTMIQHARICRVLVVAPLTAIPVWEEQIEIDCPNLRYSILRPNNDVDWTHNVVITNYEYLSPRLKKKSRAGNYSSIPGKMFRDTFIQDMLLNWEPEVVILDESHKIKNRTAKAAKACHKLGRVCVYAVCMTGTPSGNKKILDLWSQFKFLQPGLLEEDYDEYKQHYVIFKGLGSFVVHRFKHMDKLAEKLRPYITNMKTTGLPKAIDIPIRIDMDSKAKVLYKQMEKEFVISLKGTTILAPIVLAKITKLCQLASGFIIDNEGNEILVHRNMLDALQEKMEELKEAEVKRVVIFARFHWEIREIRKLLTRWVTYEISGNVPLESRKLAVQLFNSSGGVMICQIASGSVAMNLQAANYMIFFSTDFSFINYTQARGRILRTGQTKPCFFYQLRCKGTVHARIYRLLEENKDAAENFMELVKGIRKDATT